MIHRFIIVGGGAAVVHFLTATLAMWTGIHPLVANIIGFVAAFPVSYQGHRNWTFFDSEASHRIAARRFLLTALLGFAANETLYAMMIRFVPFPPIVSLIIVLGSVAGGTFAICRLWAFPAKPRLEFQQTGTTEIL